MTPTELIDQIVLSYGQIGGRRDDIFDWTKEILREVETVLQPEYTLSTSTHTLSGATTLTVSDTISIVSVAHNDGNSVLHPITRTHFDSLSSETPACMFYYAQQTPDGHTIYFNSSPTDNVVVRSRIYTDLGSDPDTDSPALDHLFPIILQGLHAKVALVLKDLDRYKAEDLHYRTMLGQLPQVSK